MRYFALVMTLAVALTGCATATPLAPASVDLNGNWAGTWEGYGLFAIKRLDTAKAYFTQQGNRGSGRIWLDGAIASESVPLSVRHAGLTGVPVALVVSGNHVIMRHALDDSLMRGEFTVTGDKMVGRMVDTDLPGRIVLERVPPPTAAAPPPAPVAMAPAPTAPPAPAPQALAPEAAPITPAPAPTPPTPDARPAPRTFSPTEALKPVYFDFDRSDVRDSEKEVLDANARWLQDNKETLVIVEGHCDERGTNAYNLALGERRARSVRDYLVSRGVASDRITTLSYGEERPVCQAHNEECWKQNRRAAFVVNAK
jgi:peptidoglycan-associated lipoprotein